MNYAIFGPDYKSDWSERMWACKLYYNKTTTSYAKIFIYVIVTVR